VFLIHKINTITKEIYMNFKTNSNYSTKKKFLIIVPSLHQGGQERVAVRTARILANDFNITILIFDGSDVGYDTEGLNIVNINVPSKPGRLHKLINILKRSYKIKQFKKAFEPTISYSFGPSSNIVNCLSRIKSEKVWTGLRSFVDINEKAKMKLCMSRGDLVVCCSNDMDIELHKLYPNVHSAVVYNPFDIEETVSLSSSEEPGSEFKLYDENGNKLQYIMTMGRDADLKCYWHMLRTFKVIVKNIPTARLMILGYGPYTEYKQMAKELGISDTVIFAGQQLNPYKYLKYASFHWMTSRTEGFPNALVEALALSLPCVNTNCWSGPAEILINGGNTGVCMESKDVIWGDWGILTPAMTRDKDLQTIDITQEELYLADVIINLLQEDIAYKTALEDANKNNAEVPISKLQHYRNVSSSRAKDFTYSEYLQKLLNLADM